MGYDVRADLYEGPLNLLVELAKFNLLDLFLVKLREFTEQYLQLVKAGGSTLNELAEPLPLLGQLVAMKARLLLPQPPPTEEEEVPIGLEELERRLREYERFKSVAEVLAQLHALQHDYFTRMQAQSQPAAQAADASTPPAVPTEVGILGLMTAFAQVLEKAQAPVYEVETEPWTVEMKIEELKLLLTVKRQATFEEVFSPEKSRLELVVIFLALLELVRRRLCRAIQEHTFGEILIVRSESTA